MTRRHSLFELYGFFVFLSVAGAGLLLLQDAAGDRVVISALAAGLGPAAGVVVWITGSLLVLGGLAGPPVLWFLDVNDGGKRVESWGAALWIAAGIATLLGLVYSGSSLISF